MKIVFSYIDSVSGDTQVMNLELACKWIQPDTTPGQLVNAINDEITRQTGEPSYYVLDHFTIARNSLAVVLSEPEGGIVTAVAGIAFPV